MVKNLLYRYKVAISKSLGRNYLPQLIVLFRGVYYIRYDVILITT